MTSELVERVARAIHKARQERGFSGEAAWEHEPQNIRDLYIACAQAALSALPQPEVTELLQPLVAKADWADRSEKVWGRRWSDGYTVSVSLGTCRKVRQALAMQPALPQPEVMALEIERLKDLLDTDRYRVAIGVQAIRKALDGRRWLSEAGRGSYTYDDERYQQEFGAALNEIAAALNPH